MLGLLETMVLVIMTTVIIRTRDVALIRSAPLLLMVEKLVLSAITMSNVRMADAPSL